MAMEQYTPTDLAEALRAIQSLISKCEKVEPKLRPGTSQATLLKNRIRALKIAAELLEAEITRLN